MDQNKEKVMELLEILKDKVDAMSEYEIESLDTIMELLENKKDLIEDKSEELLEGIEEVRDQFEDDDDEKTFSSVEELGKWASEVSQASKEILLENVMDESLDKAISIMRENTRKLYASFEETAQALMGLVRQQD
ncbi:MAG TPA: hypothetical protein PL190_01820 [Caldisericia bacterium]|jgi:hypothetical protein|nr:MAG: hypothetical protein BWX90_00795 [bacterium ADurb.Bin132]HNY61583.1 hypothetical protein [Caldisericia bacterium]HOC79182.1 hypothetical protein [Caldisericia bacterium]HOG70483.1 hypothetical protein [Caldisericia bacterium]HPA65258.1 hypothetical protein [Caldisericia bacterium]